MKKLKLKGFRNLSTKVIRIGWKWHTDICDPGPKCSNILGLVLLCPSALPWGLSSRKVSDQVQVSFEFEEGEK